MHQVLDITAGVQHWPTFGPYTAWAYQVEGAFYPLGRQGASPYLLLALGYFEANHENPGWSDLRGPAKAVALGLKLPSAQGWGVALEGVIRFDPESMNSELRGLLAFSPALRDDQLPGKPKARLTVVGMVPLTGPWHLTDPGYAATFATPVTEATSVGLSVALLHWRITEPRRALVPYLWDTYAVIFRAGWRSALIRGPVSLHAQAGPAASVMVEGPDGGLRGGAHLELGADLESALPLALSAGWLWINRATVRNLPGTDQHGLILSAGLHF